MSSTYTLPANYYTDSNQYEIDKEKIFYKTWQYVGHISSLPCPNSFFTAQIADESLVITRDEKHQLYAFYNVCRHRAHQLASGSGQCSKFVCPYHAWSYSLDGWLYNAPNTDSIKEFDTKVRLQAVRLEMIAGLIFVNLDDNPKTLKDSFPNLEEEILEKKPTLHNMRLAFTDDVSHDCNWKVSVENFSETYHLDSVHRLYSSRKAESLYISRKCEIHLRERILEHVVPRNDGKTIQVWYLWPNVAVEIFPEHNSVSIRHIKPTGPKTTVYSYSWFVDSELPAHDVKEIISIGELYKEYSGAEDAVIVKSVQKGLESRSYDTGQLVIPSDKSCSEHGVRHVQQLYLSALE